MSKLWEKIFYIFSFVTQGSSYLSPWAYGILHRMHHAYADTEKDPHSPKFSRNIWALMWKTKKIYGDISRDIMDVPENLKKNLPEWQKFDAIADTYYVRMLWIAIYVLLYAMFDAPWWTYMILMPIQIVMGPFHGAIINWYAHKVGYISFKSNDTSRNLLPVDFLMLGESYHNNHHKFPHRSNFGIKWHEFDPVYPVIVLFSWLRIIRFTKTNV